MLQNFYFADNRNESFQKSPSVRCGVAEAAQALERATAGFKLLKKLPLWAAGRQAPVGNRVLFFPWAGSSRHFHAPMTPI